MRWSISLISKQHYWWQRLCVHSVCSSFALFKHLCFCCQLRWYIFLIILKFCITLLHTFISITSIALLWFGSRLFATTISPSLPSGCLMFLFCKIQFDYRFTLPCPHIMRPIYLIRIDFELLANELNELYMLSISHSRLPRTLRALRLS